ncbi:class I SAM-dependent methyltransferase [Salegentibacter sp. F188]|uniref:Class I SAM-dependent methyltransferase n=1 Tax=Autumnicola patrickiae TaxID=3075591 RepID=A0ABU3DY01_9FLAO|nr:class I SAM-dependent methyltransferase [Salegentibacter sp. F188]MDT0688570.1 class I SAM-dependent methyltransferase [Salegentibacter sp. F188]
MNNKHNDIFGKAISAFFHQKDETDITVHSPDFDDDVIPVPYLFRNFSEMPEIEQEALKACFGKVLDVGCGAGSHSLYLQNKKKLEVTAIDTSEGAIEICRLRGVKDARNLNFFNIEDQKFDTVLMLMNGTGIIGNLKNLNSFFKHLESILNPGGQLLIDSSDLSYLQDEDDEDFGNKYIGELQFQLSYKGEKSESFDWLYIDFDSLKHIADYNNFDCELLKNGPHYDYLARLQPKSK